MAATTLSPSSSSPYHTPNTSSPPSPSHSHSPPPAPLPPPAESSRNSSHPSTPPPLPPQIPSQNPPPIRPGSRPPSYYGPGPEGLIPGQGGSGVVVADPPPPLPPFPTQYVDERLVGLGGGNSNNGGDVLVSSSGSGGNNHPNINGVGTGNNNDGALAGGSGTGNGGFVPPLSSSLGAGTSTSEADIICGPSFDPSLNLNTMVTNDHSHNNINIEDDYDVPVLDSPPPMYRPPLPDPPDAPPQLQQLPPPQLQLQFQPGFGSGAASGGPISAISGGPISGGPIPGSSLPPPPPPPALTPPPPPPHPHPSMTSDSTSTITTATATTTNINHDRSRRQDHHDGTLMMTNPQHPSRSNSQPLLQQHPATTSSSSSSMDSSITTHSNNSGGVGSNLSSSSNLIDLTSLRSTTGSGRSTNSNPNGGTRMIRSISAAATGGGSGGGSNFHQRNDENNHWNGFGIGGFRDRDRDRMVNNRSPPSSLNSISTGTFSTLNTSSSSGGNSHSHGHSYGGTGNGSVESGTGSGSLDPHRDQPEDLTEEQHLLELENSRAREMEREMIERERIEREEEEIRMLKIQYQQQYQLQQQREAALLRGRSGAGENHGGGSTRASSSTGAGVSSSSPFPSSLPPGAAAPHHHHHHHHTNSNGMGPNPNPPPLGPLPPLPPSRRPQPPLPPPPSSFGQQELGRRSTTASATGAAAQMGSGHGHGASSSSSGDGGGYGSFSGHGRRQSNISTTSSGGYGGQHSRQGSNLSSTNGGGGYTLHPRTPSHGSNWSSSSGSTNPNQHHRETELKLLRSQIADLQDRMETIVGGESLPVSPATPSHHPFSQHESSPTTSSSSNLNIIQQSVEPGTPVSAGSAPPSGSAGVVTPGGRGQHIFPGVQQHGSRFGGHNNRSNSSLGGRPGLQSMENLTEGVQSILTELRGANRVANLAENGSGFGGEDGEGGDINGFDDDEPAVTLDPAQVEELEYLLENLKHLAHRYCMGLEAVVRNHPQPYPIDQTAMEIQRILNHMGRGSENEGLGQQVNKVIGQVNNSLQVTIPPHPYSNGATSASPISGSPYPSPNYIAESTYQPQSHSRANSSRVISPQERQELQDTQSEVTKLQHKITSLTIDIQSLKALITKSDGHVKRLLAVLQRQSAPLASSGPHGGMMPSSSSGSINTGSAGGGSTPERGFGKMGSRTSAHPALQSSPGISSILRRAPSFASSSSSTHHQQHQQHFHHASSSFSSSTNQPVVGSPGSQSLMSPTSTAGRTSSDTRFSFPRPSMETLTPVPSGERLDFPSSSQPPGIGEVDEDGGSDQPIVSIVEDLMPDEHEQEQRHQPTISTMASSESQSGLDLKQVRSYPSYPKTEAKLVVEGAGIEIEIELWVNEEPEITGWLRDRITMAIEATNFEEPGAATTNPSRRPNTCASRLHFGRSSNWWTADVVLPTNFDNSIPAGWFRPVRISNPDGTVAPGMEEALLERRNKGLKKHKKHQNLVVVLKKEGSAASMRFTKNIKKWHMIDETKGKAAEKDVDAAVVGKVLQWNKVEKLSGLAVAHQYGHQDYVPTKLKWK